MVAHRKESQGTTSLAEFIALPDDGNLHEFVRGEIRVSPPPHSLHGWIESRITIQIGRYLDDRAQALGWSLEQGPTAQARLVGLLGNGEFGIRFTLPDDPNQIRGVDLVFIPAEQYLHVGWNHEGYFPEVPRLVVEVISPSETATDVDEKRQDYLTGGARRVWSIYPLRHTVHIHDATAPTRVLHIDDTLTDDDLLPGFALPLKAIFPTP